MDFSMIEIFPDEILLEICRYLHCSDVLYSFFDLNSRLNRTITSYCQHVWFRRASHKQLLHIYEQILPRIGSTVVALTIHPLHQSSFPQAIQLQLSKLFSNLKTLTLTSWTSANLIQTMIDHLQEFEYLEKLVIQELTSSDDLSDWTFLKEIFTLKNRFLTNLTFDYDCDSFDLKKSVTTPCSSYNLQQLTIQLETINDFVYLTSFIPNIVHLDVSIKNSSLKCNLTFSKLLHLKRFSLWIIYWYSQYEDLIPLLAFAPLIEQIFVTISTRDLNLILGTRIHSILPTQLKQFHYTVCYNSYDDFDSNLIEQIKQSWSSLMPIRLSSNENDKRIFLHTLPYSNSRLIIRSSLAKNMPVDNLDEIYSKVDQIQVYTMTNISDIFPILKQSHRVRELTLLIPTKPTVPMANSQTIRLSTLNRLDILTIEGTPSDLIHFKELLHAAPNLSVLVIDFDCLLNLLENEDQPLITYVYLNRHILDLCIRVQQSTFTIEHIRLISRVFSRTRNLTIDFETPEDFSDTNLIPTVLDRFEQLVIFHIYGKIPQEILNFDIKQWILQQTTKRIQPNHIFRVECTATYFKIWL